MFENTILVVKIEQRIGLTAEEAINVYRVESGMFKHIAHMPAQVSEGVTDWLAENGYTRAVAFEDDAISGLYARQA
jgi:hypothetical protein